jgi:carboxylesterase
VTRPTVPVLAGAEPYEADAGPLGVLLLHGFGGSPGSLRAMARWFEGRGVSVRLPRLPGHGTDVDDMAVVRWPAWVEEADRALDALLERCRAVGVLGHSMGAALALHLAAMRPEDVAGLALANPYLCDRRLMLVPVGRLFVKSTSAGHTDSASGAHDPGRYARRPVAAIATLRAFLRHVDRELSKVTAPIALFTSTVDHEIPPGSGDRIASRVASTRIERIDCPNSYHALPLDPDAPMVCERTLTFLRSVTGIEAPTR